MREVRCPACGTINRIPRFFITRAAKCGACKKAALPEPAYVRVLRPFYRWRGLIPITAIALFLIGLVVSAEWDSWMLGLSCSAQKRPPHGVVTQYQNEPASIPLLITSSAGSDYFVKFVTPTGSPVTTLYIHGGQDLQVLMPAGTFIEKDAAGDQWCGEQNLFGASTTIDEGVNWVTLTDDGSYRLRLSKQVDGNFPTKRISRKDF
jgi:hypothetical protein